MIETYPYLLKKDNHFNLESIPINSVQKNINFFYTYKRSSENLYRGEIGKDHLLLKPSSSLLYEIIPFLINFEEYFRVIDIHERSRRILPKICWLADSFFKNGLAQPICVHYNPRIQQNVIHPGGIRNHLIKLFHDLPTVDCFYFNTGGVKFDFMKELQVVSSEELLSCKETMYIHLVADHCSIIPHINLDPWSVNLNVEKWTEFIYRRLSNPNFKIYSNKTITHMEPWTTVNDEHAIEITISENLNEWDPEWNDVVCKSIILSIIGKSYKSDLLTVVHKIAVTTP